MPGTQKAYLETEKGERITCVFNPSSLTMGASNRWQSDETPGKGPPNLFFAGSDAGTFSTELVFDTTDTGKAVTTHTSKLFDLMKVDAGLPGHDPKRNRGRPPWVRFHWGEVHSFKAILDRLDVSFTYFSSSGVPLRARVNLTLTQFEDEATRPAQNPTSGTPSPHRVHQVHAGETLDRIAARYYGAATRWRVIADANAVVDPLRVQPGTMLVIPELPAESRR